MILKPWTRDLTGAVADRIPGARRRFCNQHASRTMSGIYQIASCRLMSKRGASGVTVR